MTAKHDCIPKQALHKLANVQQITISRRPARQSNDSLDIASPRGVQLQLRHNQRQKLNNNTRFDLRQRSNATLVRMTKAHRREWRSFTNKARLDGQSRPTRTEHEVAGSFQEEMMAA